jgi:hypothetical protein
LVQEKKEDKQASEERYYKISLDRLQEAFEK